MPPIDDRTTRLDLPKPAQPNTLRNDVQRLRDTIDKLDAKVATLDANGEIENSQVRFDIARLDQHLTLKPDQLPANVVTKDANGKIDSSLLKDDVVTNIWDVASETLMLDLTQASVGDIANFPQSGRTFKLMRLPPTERANWKEQVATAVTSVNGRTGDVVVAEPGVNADITQLTKLSGPLTLGGDGAGDNDAVTMRQLKGAMGTSGGASMTGVMNNFIGAVEWFNGPLTAIPAGYIPANGQALSRNAEATRDLWTAVDKGMLTSMTEALWITDSIGGVSNRASYSQGGAAGTCPDKTITDDWFRAPDLNGFQLNSIPNLYLMGWNGQKINNTYSIGAALSQGAPNILGSFKTRVPNGHANEANGAFRGASGIQGLNGNVPVSYGNMVFSSPTTTLSDYPDVAGYGYTFNAQMGAESYKAPGFLDYKTYGAYTDGALRPNNAVGYWIIRANGSFQAANSKFEVINAYNPLPASGAITGGFIQGSLNDDKGKTVNAVGVTVVNTIGGKPAAQFGVGNWDSTSQDLKWKHMDLSSADGSLTVPGAVWASPMPAAQSVSELGQLGVKAATQPNSIYIHSQIGGTGTVVNRLKGEWYTASYELFAVRTDTSHLQYTSWRFTPFSGQANNYFEITIDAGGMVSMPGGQKFAHDGTAHFPGNISAVTSTWPSDRDLKDDIEPIADALGKIEQLNGYSFTFKNTGMKSAGIIAQELAQAMPDLVSTNPDGHLAVQYNGVIGLLVAAVKELKAQNADLQAQIDALKP
ncbi:tail fiber domain-containing protein [Salmonella enterica]|nr:tail fiber domain-containing protein [Salmonella enterica]